MHTRQGRHRGNFLAEMKKKRCRQVCWQRFFLYRIFKYSLNIEANRSERQ